MQTLRTLLVIPLVLVLAVPAFASPQRHVVDPSGLATAVDGHAASRQAERAAIREALGRPQVQELAKKVGMDLEHVSAKLATLDGADLDRAAAAAHQVNDALAGGASTVVISTTTIIIALLVVILLIVALK